MGFNLITTLNRPPVVLSTPAPLFVNGVASTHDMTGHFSDPDDDTLTYSLTKALPSGLSFNPTTGILSYDGIGAASVSQHTVIADDGEFTVETPTFDINIPGGLDFPRVSSYVIGGVQAWAEDVAGGDYIRQGIAKLDVVFLGMNPDIIDDTTTPGGTMSRRDIVIDLHDKSAALFVFDYANGQETRNLASSATATKLYDESGPAGADSFWDTQSSGKNPDGGLESDGTDLTPIGPHASTGIAITDWWSRDASGFKKATFAGNPNPYSINVTDNTQVDAMGRRYTEWAVDINLGPDQLDPFLISNGGPGFGQNVINIYIDVFDLRPLSDNIDWNGDGRNDEARNIFDAHNSAHQTDDETDVHLGGVHSAGKWRGGRRALFDLIKTRYPGIIITGNVTTWSKQNSTFGAITRDVQPEYQTVEGTSVPATNVTPRQSMIQGGIAGESQTLNEGFPVTGIGADGIPNGLGFPGAEAGFWLAYNQYRYMVEVSDDPKLACMDFTVEAFQAGLPDVNGRKAWDWVPDPASKFHLMRLGLCMALLSDGFFNISPIRVGTTRTGKFQGPVICDEFGTINTSTTGLSKGWLGQPVTAGTVIVPVVGAGNQAILIREYTNGWDVVSTSKTQSLVLPVSFLGGAGATKKFLGFQDSSHNDGSVINGDLTVPKIDGFCLQKVA